MQVPTTWLPTQAEGVSGDDVGESVGGGMSVVMAALGVGLILAEDPPSAALAEALEGVLVPREQAGSSRF